MWLKNCTMGGGALNGMSVVHQKKVEEREEWSRRRKLKRVGFTQKCDIQ